MSKRKPHNPKARLERFSRSVLRQHHIAVVNIDPTGKQGLINWHNCKSVARGRHIADAICDIAHHWTIYLAALCVDQFGQQYIKAMTEKIRRVRAMIGARPIHLEVDGGVTPANARECVGAGADVLVAGSAAFKDAKYAENIAAIRKAAMGG